MPAFSKRFLPFWAVCLTLVVWLSLLSRESIGRDYDETLLKPVSLVDPLPAGDIAEGVGIEQSFQLSGSAIETSKRLRKDTKQICLQLYLANYSNRRNRGLVKVSLGQAGLRLSRVIDMGSVADNAFHQVCFSTDDFDGFRENDLTVMIEGVNGKAGTSITAWLTGDLDHGRAYLNGIDTKKALRFGLSLRIDRRGISYPALALLSIYSALIFSVFLFTAGKAAASPPTQ